jgi:DNA-binding response OmpR family regulator
LKRILLIEDDRKIALALTLRLQAAGYQAATACDALTGVAAAVKNPPDLLLLDVCLPVSNGFAVAESLQTLLPRSVPVIFLTASKQPGFRQKADALGAVGYFEKPYEAKELLAAIERALNPV